MWSYWDDVEQRLFYRVLEGVKTKTRETTVAVLPRWGHALDAVRLTNADLLQTNVRELFEKKSDGLAELGDDDLLDIILPVVPDSKAREGLVEIVDALLEGRVTVASVVNRLINQGRALQQVCQPDRPIGYRYS